MDSSALEPRWRNIIGLDTLLWLKDHRVDSLVVFPGAAYICMAIEAMCELLETQLSATRVSVKDILFLKAFIIPPMPEKVEVQLSLNTPLYRGKGPGSTCREFRITSLSSDGKWTQNCCGKSRVDFPTPESHDDEPDPESDHQIATKMIPALLQQCKVQVIDSRDVYEKLKANGNFYGSQFAAISKLEVRDEKEATARVIIRDMPSTTPSKRNQLHVIHPTTLDALMHSSLPLYTYRNSPGSIMPVSIEELTISSDFESRPGEQVFARVTLASEGPRTAKMQIMGFNTDRPGKSGPALLISGMELRGLGEKHGDNSLAPDLSGISYQMEWGQDPDYIRLPNTKSFMPKGFDKSQIRKISILSEAASVYTHRTYNRMWSGCH